MSDESGPCLIAHLEALRRTLAAMLGVTALLYPVGFWLAPRVIDFLVRASFPEGIGGLHYFTPMEVFWAQLKLALVLALVLAYPWNIRQIWKFLHPALYPRERRMFGWWLGLSTVLFAGGVVFCAGGVLPLLMRFSASFASPDLQPLLGLAAFLSLAGGLMLAFGLMAQMPVLVLLAVRFGGLSAATVARARPYVVIGILVVAALLTPPDVISQVMLALPTWILFELGLWLARRRMEPSS